MNLKDLQKNNKPAIVSSFHLFDHDHSCCCWRAQLAMLGLTISRRAIQVPTKRFATRSISRPTVISFRPRTGSLAPDTSSHHHLQTLSFKTPFARGFHHETVSSSTADAPVEHREVGNKGKQDLSRCVVASSRQVDDVVQFQGARAHAHTGMSGTW
jgi:hypothetical protein